MLPNTKKVICKEWLYALKEKWTSGVVFLRINVSDSVYLNTYFEIIIFETVVVRINWGNHCVTLFIV